MANGTRHTGIVNQAIDLKFQVTLNGQAYDLLANGGTVDKVELYPTQTDAENETNIIATLNYPVDFTHLGNGLFKYTTVGANQPTPDTYYDVFYYTPPAAYGQPQEKHINWYVVRDADFAGGVNDHPKRVLIFSWADRDLEDDDSEIPVRVILNANHKYDDGSGNKLDVVKQKHTFYTDQNRYWETSPNYSYNDTEETGLVVTEYLETGAHYIITVGKKTYKKIIETAKIGTAYNLHDLTDYTG